MARRSDSAKAKGPAPKAERIAPSRIDQSHFNVSGPKPGDFNAEDYAARGWGSVHRDQPASNQSQFNLGPNYPEMRHEPVGSDISHEPRVDKRGKPQPSEHEAVMSGIKEKHGLSYEDMVHNAGASIDRAMMRNEATQPQNEVQRVAEQHARIAAGQPSRSPTATGQRWYAGGEPDTAQEINQGIAKEHGVAPHVVNYMRASMSHNESAEHEPERVKNVLGGLANRPKRGINQFDWAPGARGAPERGDEREAETPSGGMHWNARNAARIAQAHQQSGTHPMDVQGEQQTRPPRGEPTRRGDRGNPAPAVLGGRGPKPASYAQGYTHPGMADARPTTDRWAYRTIFNTDTDTAKEIQAHGPQWTRVTHPDTGQQTHGVNLVASEAMADASRRRGIAPHEGQTLSWNEDKDVAEKVVPPLEHVLNQRQLQQQGPQGKLF